MAEKTLFLEIFQPFAQYRNPFTFYYAQTYPLPPKSTIIGMLQNATDSYYDERFWNLKVSVHGGFESAFWNYQQLIKGEVTVGRIGLLNKQDKNPLGGKIWHPLYHSAIKARRTPVYQQELFNGHLFIFIRGDESLIDLIRSCLENSKKVLYLGRSEDVIFLKKEPIILEYEGLAPEKPKTVKKSLWLRYPMYIKLNKDNRSNDKFPIKNNKFPVYSIPVIVKFKNNERMIRSKAELTKNTTREVEFEPVIYTGVDYAVYLNGKIDVEVIRIDDEKVFKIPVGYGWL